MRGPAAPVIRGVVAGTDTESAVSLLSRDWDGVDAIELRIDTMMAPDLERLLTCPRSLPVVVTVRPQWEGGKFQGTENERIKLLEEASRLGAEAVDVEHRAKSLPGLHERTSLILSYHDFEGTPANLNEIRRDMEAREPREVKIVTTARSPKDLVSIRRLLGEPREGVDLRRTAFCMGSIGLPSRILAGAWGSAATYVALEKNQASAPGQLTVEDLQAVYGQGPVDPDTRVFGVAGNPVGQSLGPLLHNRFFLSEGRSAVYVPFLADSLNELIEVGPGLSLFGLSVTIPHKNEAARLTPDLNPEAKACGAANTLLFDGVSSVPTRGFSFDGEAAAQAIEDGVGGKDELKRRLERGPLVVVGAGGTAAAVGFALTQRGARGFLVNRGKDRGEALAKRLGLSFRGLEDLGSLDPSVVVHTTSVGMAPDVTECLIPASALPSGCVVMDAVYRPIETRLLGLARERGCLCISGLEMFIRQAAMQANEFAGKPFPLDWARELLLDALGEEKVLGQ